ncbi:hypothetical protein [Streptacidiphilus albus]|uniref:hypothetical protein n=1 Tax=Streptacidiphilus albus TaxID=105425 RepID=UPI0012E03071|nr:hypothetical protein [Streptacidiphilus albus]
MTYATTATVVLALTAPTAVAQDLGPYHFKGTVWNPKALPAAPVVSGHALTKRTATTHPKDYRALGSYQATAPVWPAAGTATVALTHTVTAVRTAASAGAPSSAVAKTASPSVPGIGSRAKTGTARLFSPSPASPAATSSPLPSAVVSQVVPVSGPVKAGSLPVWVAPVAATATGGKRSATLVGAQAPAQVRVQVASHAQTLAAGADGMLLEVARADGRTAAGSVQVVIDYSTLVKAYGGGFGSRLELVVVPACALTTPQVVACRTRTPVAFSNRANADQLTATLPLSVQRASATAAQSPLSSGSARSALSAQAAGTGLEVISGTSGSQGNYAATSRQL